LARLGRAVQFATALADDEHGAMIAAHLNQAAVSLVGEPHTLERTATALATLSDDGSATYTFDLEWRINPVPDVSPTVVHTGSIGAVLDPGATQVRQLLERARPTATISYDINARPGITGTEPSLVRAVEDIAACADLVKASDEDLAALWPDQGDDQVVAKLLATGPSAVVVTRGSAGASWYGSTGRVDVASVGGTVADTIGAGDTFSAATLDALWSLGLLGGRLPQLEPATVQRVLRHAANAAAITVSRPGADPPYPYELPATPPLS
jgi:fructokinase